MWDLFQIPIVDVLFFVWLFAILFGFLSWILTTWRKR